MLGRLLLPLESRAHRPNAASRPQDLSKKSKMEDGHANGAGIEIDEDLHSRQVGEGGWERAPSSWRGRRSSQGPPT